MVDMHVYLIIADASSRWILKVTFQGVVAEVSVPFVPVVHRVVQVFYVALVHRGQTLERLGYIFHVFLVVIESDKVTTRSPFLSESRESANVLFTLFL